jgi:hypothetical protein
LISLPKGIEVVTFGFFTKEVLKADLDGWLRLSLRLNILAIHQT